MTKAIRQAARADVTDLRTAVDALDDVEKNHKTTAKKVLEMLGALVLGAGVVAATGLFVSMLAGFGTFVAVMLGVGYSSYHLFPESKGTEEARGPSEKIWNVLHKLNVVDKEQI